MSIEEIDWVEVLPSKKTFGERNSRHEEYITQVMDKIRSHKCVVERIGVEKKLKKDFMSQLMSLVKDQTASFLRFQPDIAGINKDHAFLCEVKSKFDKSPNVSMELEPFEKVLDLRRIGIRIFYVLPDFKVAYPEKIKMDEIHVPDRWGEERYLEIKNRNPKIKVEYKPWSKKGSGTIYFLIKTQQLNDFIDLDYFLDVTINQRLTLIDYFF